MEGIKKIIQEAQLSNVSSLELGKSGYASQSYQVVCDQGKLIILTPKADAISPPDYAYCYAVMRQLEKVSYPHAPKPIYLSADQQSIVMTQVPGEPSMWLNEAPSEQQRAAIRAIIDGQLKLKAVSFDSTAELYKKLTSKELKPSTIQDNNKKYTTDWMELAETGRPDSDMKRWLLPKVEACTQAVMHTPASDKITFVHGDTVAGNVFFTQDLQLHFIDWDTSDFKRYPDRWNDYNLHYILLQVPYFQQNRDYAINYFARQAVRDQKKFEAGLTELQEITQINDIVWAYMMHARASAGEIKQPPEKFYDIAQERIAAYEQNFAPNSFISK
jgi:aminoglycoside phosphotransferase (APT) family kinase protein